MLFFFLPHSSNQHNTLACGVTCPKTDAELSNIFSCATQPKDMRKSVSYFLTILLIIFNSLQPAVGENPVVWGPGVSFRGSIVIDEGDGTQVVMEDGLNGVVHVNSKHEHVDMYRGRIVKDDLETAVGEKTGEMVEDLKKENKQVTELETMIKESAKSQRLQQGHQKTHFRN